METGLVPCWPTSCQEAGALCRRTGNSFYALGCPKDLKTIYLLTLPMWLEHFPVCRHNFDRRVLPASVPTSACLLPSPHPTSDRSPDCSVPPPPAVLRTPLPSCATSCASC